MFDGVPASKPRLKRRWDEMFVIALKITVLAFSKELPNILWDGLHWKRRYASKSERERER